MDAPLKLSGLLLLALSASCAPAVPSAPAATTPTQAAQVNALSARIIAVGIPGANAVSPVGAFHAGGPIHDTPEFAAYTQQGRELDPERILVTSGSNFGAPKARSDQPEGSALSLDPRGPDT